MVLCLLHEASTRKMRSRSDLGSSHNWHSTQILDPCERYSVSRHPTSPGTPYTKPECPPPKGPGEDDRWGKAEPPVPIANHADHR
jgi:hypothetical protein